MDGLNDKPGGLAQVMQGVRGWADSFSDHPNPADYFYRSATIFCGADREFCSSLGVKRIEDVWLFYEGKPAHTSFATEGTELDSHVPFEVRNEKQGWEEYDVHSWAVSTMDRVKAGLLRKVAELERRNVRTYDYTKSEMEMRQLLDELDEDGQI